MGNKLLQAALDYAELGWHIFPCRPRGKEPLTSHGVKDAATDKEQIERWWARWPEANIGCACGSRSGFYVIDVDISPERNTNGIVSLKEFPALPTTCKQDTGSGGFHSLFKSANSPANKNFFAPGIDIRGEGYYVILAPSIHPNGEQYKWAEGCSPWEIELTEFPEFMRPGEKCDTTSKLLNVPDTCKMQPDDVIKRASAYLETCDPAVQGQGGHGKLLYAASRLVNGFDLTDQEAYSILAEEYNPRCVPPWDLADQKDEKDFRRKISEARKLGSNKPKGWLLNDSVESFSCIVDIDSLLCGIRKCTTENTKVSLSKLNYFCNPPGLVGEICQWLNQTSLRSQPLLSLAASLVFCGALIGRKVKDELGSRTNLYCMGVAPSSAGKQHAITQLRNLCSISGTVDLLGGDYIASDTSIEERLSRSPCTLFLWDEVGHLLSHIRSGLSKNHVMVVSLLMKLYSCAGSVYLGREYAEKEKQRTIIQPCCCVYGTSTPERFVKGISPEELQDGWLSRCLVFRSDEVPEKSRLVNNQEPPPQSIIEQVRKWYEFAPEKQAEEDILKYVTPYYDEQPPEQVTVKTTNEAKDVFVQFDRETSKFGRENPQLACLWAKGEENARRIALIISAGMSFSEPTIGIKAATYACDLVRHLLSDFTEFVAPEIVSNETERNKRKLYHIINNSGVEGITRGELTQQTRWANKRQRQDLIEDLLYGGEIFFELGDKVAKYWSVEHYAKRKPHNSNTTAN
jgi:hypothetical protein